MTIKFWSFGEANTHSKFWIIIAFLEIWRRKILLSGTQEASGLVTGLGLFTFCLLFVLIILIIFAI